MADVLRDANPALLPYGGTWNGIIGVSGGIPARLTRSGSVLANTSTSAQIQTAINNCTAEQYIELASGNFANATSDITITKSNVTLRGAVDANGAPNTTLHCGISFQAAAWNMDTLGSFSGTQLTVTSGATRGSRTIGVSGNPSSLAIGQMLILCAPDNATISGGGWSPLFSTYNFSQWVKVVSKTTNSITFEPAINADYLSGSIICVWKASATEIWRTGVENVYLTVSSGAQLYFKFTGAGECWIKNCKTYHGGDAARQVYFYGGYRNEMRHCEVSNFTTYSANNYPVMPQHTHGLWIEDCYFHDCPQIAPIFGMGGSVFSYNYCTDFPYSPAEWLSQGVYFHGSHNHYNLFEGNWVASMYHDSNADGTDSCNNLHVRQRMLGWDATGPKNNSCRTVSAYATQQNLVIAACVLGKYPTPIGPDSQVCVYDGGDLASQTPAIYGVDSATRGAGFLRLGNYNTVDQAIRAAETTALGGNTVAASYVYSSKPSWWGTAQPWPWVDPANYTQSNTMENFPAGYRVTYGTDPSSGGGTPPVGTPVLSVR